MVPLKRIMYVPYTHQAIFVRDWPFRDILSYHWSSVYHVTTASELRMYRAVVNLTTVAEIRIGVTEQSTLHMTWTR